MTETDTWRRRAVARHGEATLLTRDRRTRPVYERLGVRHEPPG